MKIYLLPENGNFYKANLHSHTTVSDGRLTPEEAKAEYMKRGYSIIAYTDHNIVLPCQELSDENFLALEGTEIDVSDYTTLGNVAGSTRIITLHINMIALRPSLPHPCWHDEESLIYGKSEHIEDYIDRMVIDNNVPQILRVYGKEGVNKMVNHAKNLGYFVTYNHPSWNLENYNRYIQYDSFDAVEILNGGCRKAGYPCDINVYDDMLKSYYRMFAVAGDDNHNPKPIDDLKSDSFVCWTMIKAENLDYASVGDALKNGHFYATEGPEIKALWIDGDVVHVETSDAVKIVLRTGRRYTECALAEGESVINEADLRVHRAGDYFRIEVTDTKGRVAYSNAYFLEDLGLETEEIKKVKREVRSI